MKNSKKLLVLVLSLVMLIAAFAMCVSAEGDKATVQYPDGTTAQYAVGETIIPPFGATYAGAGNTLYKNAGDGWKFSVDGAPLASLTITEDLIGKTITASGYDKVYFSVAETGGSTIYYTDASTVATDFRTYMQAMLSPAGATVTLYEDISCASLAVQGANTSLNYYLDLNGHKLTITSSGIALDVRQYSFYLYSSKPGGVLDASAGSCAFRTNDGKVNGIQQWGKLYVGEDSENGAKYYDNLTVYCKAINTDMYGTGAYFLGGKYVQTAASTSTYMLVIGRVGNVSNSQVQKIRNCTFVTCKAATSPIEQSAKDARIYDGCTFINTAGGLGKIFSNATMNGNPEFKNCKFYNVDPAASYGGKELKYSGTTVVGFTDAMPERPAGEYVAHIAEQTVVVDGNTYVFDSTFITDTSVAYGVNWGGIYTDYWMVGTTPSAPASALNYIVENANGTASYFGGASYAAQDVVTDNIIGTVGYVEVSYDSAAPLAMKWTLGTIPGYLLLGDLTAAEIGQVFYETFDQINSGADIKLYADVVIPEAIGFGPLGKSDSADEYKSFTMGNVTLDLNGHKFEVSADAKGINPSNSNQAGTYPKDCHGVFVFEVSSSYTFTIKSSIAGAEIVNNAPFALVVIGEGSGANFVVDGANITYTGERAFLHSFEAGSANVQINGGTYVITGKSTAFSGLFNVSIKNAKIMMTGDEAVAVLGVHTWKRNAIYSLENVVITSKKVIPIFSFVGNGNFAAGSPADDSKTFSLTMKDCTFAGIDLTKNAHLDTYAISGVTKADTEAGLLAVYGSKPAGTTLAQYVVEMNGEIVTFLGYGKATEIFTVTYDGADTEYYLVGSVLQIPAAEELVSPYYKDGYYVSVEGYKGYLANAVVTAEMAGKSADAFANINYVENALAFAIVKDGEIVGHVLLNAEDLSAELVAALAEANDGAELRFYADIEFASIAFFDPAVTLNLNGHVLTVSEKVSNLAPITVENGTIYYIGFWTSLFHADVTLDNVSIYNFGNYGTRVILNNTTNVVINDSKLYNLDIDCDGYRNVVMTGTVFHDDETLDGLIYNNNVEYVTCGGTTFEVTYTRAVTSDASKIVTATFTYKGEVKGTFDYYIGSIPGFFAEAIEGYYYSYVTEEAFYEDTEFVCLFIADEGKLKGQIVVTEALNFIFYLQKQEGIESIVFNGEALNFADIAVETIDGVDYYVIPVEFESFADCLLPVTLEVGVAFGEEIEIVTANVSLLDYAREIFAGEYADEDKALVYALLTYVDSIINYFKYDVESALPAILAANAEYATEYVAVETEALSSDYIRGALYIVDEQVSLALRVDADFKGEIIVSLPGEGGVKATFIYKNIVEIDGNCYVVLDNVPFCELADGYDISVKMYGEQVESFNYSIANYANAMTMQNMGYIPGYARALSVFATLAAAYVA